MAEQRERRVKMTEDIEKLRVLLPHWVEHNEEHARSFREWAERARAAGEEHVAAHIEAAAEKMIAANADLAGAIAHVGEGESHPHIHHHHHGHDHPHSH